MAQGAAANIVVSYSFDDDNIATGPDTFRVFNYARGNVSLTTNYCHSGYRAVEIRDAAGDKEFPELQGYFPLRKRGQLFAHFAFMTTAPNEPLNIALAGPQWFTVRKDGIGFWLSTRDGVLYHNSKKLAKPLLTLDAFAAGDAAFYAQSYPEAQRLYEASRQENDKNLNVLLKLSDVYFLFGDLSKERFYREQVYGTLGAH
jgi:hypothetical protein